MATLRKRNVLTARTPKAMIDGKIKWLSKDMISGSIRFSIVGEGEGDYERGFVVTLTKDEFAELVALNGRE